MHPDARTNAPDTDYFFLGEGEISAAIQWSRNREMAPYGLLLMRPGTFHRKESTLLFHPEFGLDRTMLTVTVQGVRYRPTHEDVRVWWASTDEADPVIAVEWNAGEIAVTELIGVRRIERGISVSDEELNEGKEKKEEETRLIREVRLARAVGKSAEAADPTTASTAVPLRVSVEPAFYPNPYVLNGLPQLSMSARNEPGFTADSGGGFCSVNLHESGEAFERFLTAHRTIPAPAKEGPIAKSEPILFSFFLSSSPSDTPSFRKPDPFTIREEVQRTEDDFTRRLLRQFDVARIGLKAAVSPQGAFDASIWQYGYEWGQDAAMCASAAVYAGEFALAERLLERILTKLSNEEGRIAESSRFRDGELAELNANGAVLLALRDYTALTNDVAFVEKHWERVVAIAELPLRDEYLHESGLIAGRRDLWERLPWMGLLTGFDTATNTFCAEGLIAAAEIAAIIGEKKEEKRWREAGEKMRAALTGDERFSCIEEGRIIARRMTDGSVQKSMTAEAGYHDRRYAPYAPTKIDDATPRPCEPDSTAALPIVYGIVDPASDVARNTLDHLRAHLWNTTGIGGYARSPLESDPDSPGPWPFATAWMAEAELRAGLTGRAQETTEWLLKTAGAGGSWFEYYGERKSPPFPPVGIIVWGWGQYLLLAARGWMGIEFNTERLRIAPCITGFRHTLRTATCSIRIEVNGLARATVNDVQTELRDGGIELALPIRESCTIVFNP